MTLALRNCTLALVGFCIGAAATAQTVWEPLQATPQQPVRATGPELASGSVGVLRALDKMSGAVEDIELHVGASTIFGRLSVQLTACRYPTENPASDAFAFLEITDTRSNERLFNGWMVASSPALNALDHARYDIWIIRCRAPE